MHAEPHAPRASLPPEDDRAITPFDSTEEDAPSTPEPELNEEAELADGEDFVTIDVEVEEEDSPFFEE